MTQYTRIIRFSTHEQEHSMPQSPQPPNKARATAVRAGQLHELGRRLAMQADGLRQPAAPDTPHAPTEDICNVAHARAGLPSIEDSERRAALRRIIDGFEADILPQLEALPRQPVPHHAGLCA